MERFPVTMRKASAIQDDGFEKARARMKAGAFEVKKKTSRCFFRLKRRLQSWAERMQLRFVDGDSGSMRYVIDIEKSSASHWYCLLIREGGVGRIRFDHVRIERI